MITARSKNRGNFFFSLAGILVVVLFLWFIISMFHNAQDVSQREAQEAVHQSIVRAVVSCYAYEGAYPDSIEYLEENYNLLIDHDRYLIYYDKIGDMLMPNIIVNEKNTFNS